MQRKRIRALAVNPEPHPPPPKPRSAHRRTQLTGLLTYKETRTVDAEAAQQYFFNKYSACRRFLIRRARCKAYPAHTDERHRDMLNALAGALSPLTLPDGLAKWLYGARKRVPGFVLHTLFPDSRGGGGR